MKKFILSIIVIVSFGFYVISQNTSSSSGNLSLPPIVSSNTNASSKKQLILIPTASSDNNNPIVSSPNTTAITPRKTGLYNDGTYVGASANAYYGNVQVKAIISNGKLTDVQFVDYPRDRNTSVRINSRALPILKKEAIVAQSANINAVSGASATSPAFIRSLSDALSQAKA